MCFLFQWVSEGMYPLYSLLDCSLHRKISLSRETLPSHLHPKLEKSILTCFGRESNPDLGGEHSSKELFEPRINSYSEHLHISPLSFHTRPILPSLQQLTQTQRLQTCTDSFGTFLRRLAFAWFSTTHKGGCVLRAA